MLKPLSEQELKVLNLLEANGILSDAELAQQLAVREDEALNIRKGLQSEGIILKYKAIVNWEKIESNDVVALIQVSVIPSEGKGYDDVSNKISELPEVVSCLLVSGSFDLLVEVVGPTLKEVAFFVAEKLAPIQGVKATKTNFLLKRYKQGGDIFGTSAKTHRLPMVI